MGPISQSVILHQAGKACQGQTLLLVWAIHMLQRKRSVGDTDPGTVFTTPHFLCNFMNQPSMLQCCIALGRKGIPGTKLQLAGPVHKLQRKGSVVDIAPGAVFTTLHQLQILQMGPISQSVILHLTEKTCQGQTLYLIGPIRKLKRKGSVVDMAPAEIC